jgi:hypothetical protein
MFPNPRSRCRVKAMLPSVFRMTRSSPNGLSATGNSLQLGNAQNKNVGTMLPKTSVPVKAGGAGPTAGAVKNQ